GILYLSATAVLYFVNDTAATQIYTLSLHDALPILAVDTGPLRLELGEGHAVVRFTALLRGGSGGLLPDAARVYQVETGWRLEQGRWWLASARWTPVVD